MQNEAKDEFCNASAPKKREPSTCDCGHTHFIESAPAYAFADLQVWLPFKAATIWGVASIESVICVHKQIEACIF